MATENQEQAAVKQNRLVSIFKTLRNNWKKTTFGLVLLGYGYNYAADKYRTHQFMRAYCEEARKYGEQSIPQSVKPRHVTVILNPAAKNGKGKKLYEKFSSPLLNLAGIRVSLIQTEQEGQARNLMEIMDKTDAVLVAGGDGTLHEAVTGLLRREDEATACKKLPVGIAPIGKKNLFAKTFFGDEAINEARLLAESTMSVVREMMEPVDVIKVQGTKGKAVYALNNVECGAFRDADTLIEKYWYYGALKANVTYLFSAFRSIPENLVLNLSYILPCQGCSRCYHSDLQEQEVRQSRWWHAFIPRSRATVSGRSNAVDYSTVINEQCGNVHHKDITSSNFSVSLCRDHGNKGLKADFEEPLNGRWMFLTDGWARHSSNPKPVQESLQCKEAEIAVESNEQEERWMSIDNEKYEKQNVKVSLP